MRNSVVFLRLWLPRQRGVDVSVWYAGRKAKEEAMRSSAPSLGAEVQGDLDRTVGGPLPGGSTSSEEDRKEGDQDSAGQGRDRKP